MGEDETVHTHHNGQGHFLGELVSLDVQVSGLLVGFRVELNPAAVALGHRVCVVVPDVDRGPDRPVRHRHDDGQAQPGRVVDGLDHVQQALAGGRRVGPGTGGGRTDGHRHRGELRLDVDVFAAGELPVFHEDAQGLDDVGLRGDRVGADDFRPAEGDGVGDGFRALDLAKHWPTPPFAGGRVHRRRSPRPRFWPRSSTGTFRGFPSQHPPG